MTIESFILLDVDFFAEVFLTETVGLDVVFLVAIFNDYSTPQKNSSVEFEEFIEK